MIGLGWKTMMTHRQINQRRCQRCQLFFAKKETTCPNCAEWTDEQVLAVKQYMETQKRANQKMGRWFLFAAVAIALLTASLWLVKN